MLCCCSMAGTSACNNCSVRPSNAKYENQIISWLQPPYLNKKDNEKIAKPVTQYWCSNCEAIIDKYVSYCHHCGAKIDWGFDKATFDN